MRAKTIIAAILAVFMVSAAVWLKIRVKRRFKISNYCRFTAN